jgi:hypothetical protein
MLGVWNDAGSNREGDLANARIYRQIHLAPGKYYFGAAFNACYQVSPNAYMFVSAELHDTYEIPGHALAFYSIAEATNNLTLYGLNFTLTEETDLYIGFQMDLTSGSSTQEIRAEEVALYLYNDMNHGKLQELIGELSAKAEVVKVGNNTGHYTAATLDALKEAISEARQVPENASVEQIVAAYEALTKAYDAFLHAGRIKGTTYDATDATDITEQGLVEIYGFTRKEGGNDRFGTPLYWTVENYGIPSNSEGVRGGLDKWPGRDNLTLGVWDDKQNAPETSDITNARVYRRVALDAGTYFFGAIYNTVDNITNAYVFAVGEPLATTDIAVYAIAIVSSIVLWLLQLIFRNAWTFIITMVLVLVFFILPMINFSSDDYDYNEYSYVEPQTSDTYYCTANSLNIRQAPSTTATSIGSLSLNERVEVLEIVGDFAKINYKGHIGYVSTKYISRY